MTLTKCPACAAEISTEAVACPKCGHPMKQQAEGLDVGDPVHVIGVVLAIIILIGFVVFGVRACNS